VTPFRGRAGAAASLSYLQLVQRLTRAPRRHPDDGCIDTTGEHLMAAKEHDQDQHGLDDLTTDHPVGTSVGAAGGAVAGATAGSVMGGPVGAVVGGVIGAVAGGLVGRGVAESANPEPQDFQHEHNLGKGIGTAGGAAVGATAGGALAGPVGAAAGAAVGAVAGGVVGMGVAHAVNHDEEDAYWREQHSREPYYDPLRTYDDYAPAYRMGYEGRARYDEGTFDQYEPAMGNDWDSFRAQSRLTWAEARHAARAGWERFERKGPHKPVERT
jgi:outer membrane lipoprotein SlyB